MKSEDRSSLGDDDNLKRKLNYEMTDFAPFGEEYTLFSTGIKWLEGEGSKI